MNWIPLYFVHYGVLILTLVIFFSIGQLIFKYLPINKPNKVFTQVFASCTVGCVVFIVLYSIALTSFKTINIVFLPLMVYMVWISSNARLRTKVDSIPVTNYIKIIIPLLILSVLCFSWEAQFILKSGDFNYIMPPRDYNRYSNISEALNLIGQENFFGEKNLISDNYHGMAPFHYFELWLTSGISKLTGLQNINVLMLVTYPIFYFLTICGFWMILEQYGKLTLFTASVVITFLFLGGVFSETHKSLPVIGDSSFLSLYPTETYGRKFGPYYLFLIPSILFFIQGQFKHFAVTLLALPIISIGTLPAVIGSLFLYGFYKRVIKKIKNSWHFVGISLAVLMCVGIVYFLFRNTQIDLRNFNGLFELDSWLKYANIKTRANIVAVTTYQVLGLYIPFIILITGFLWYKKIKLSAIQKQLVIFTCFLYITALLSWSFLFQISDSIQFFSNGFILFFNMVIIVFILVLFPLNGKYKLLYLAAVFFISPMIIHSYSVNSRNIKYTDEYLLQVSECTLPKNVSSIGALFISAEDFQGEFASIKTSLDIYPLGVYLKFMPQYYTWTHLCPHDAPVSETDTILGMRQEKMISQTPFFLFVNQQKSNEEFTSYNQSQIDFIMHHNIGYAIFSRNYKPHFQLKEIIDTTIIDERSGEKFVLFK